MPEDVRERYIAISIVQTLACGLTTTHVVREISDEDKVGEPESLASAVAECVIAAMPYDTWLADFADELNDRFQAHLQANATKPDDR